MRRRAVIATILLAAVVSLPTARAEIVRVHKVTVRFDAALLPHRLPRRRTAPIAVRIGGRIDIPRRRPPPVLRRIVVGINRSGVLSDRGLGICREEQLEASTPGAAKRTCSR